MNQPERRTPPTIALLTDFGLRDPYVGCIRGVLLERAPFARVVDVTHEIPAHDLLEASFTLACVYDHFPEGTVFLAVVDPGVGGARRPVAVACGGRMLVAPDNGLLSGVLDAHPPEAAHVIDVQRLGIDDPHPTFHGRDLFAPAAAWLAQGNRLETLGPSVSSLERLHPAPSEDSGGAIEATVLHIDRFGNVTVGLLPRDLPRGLPRGLRRESGETALRHATTYEGGGDALLCLWGSAGRLELALERASAAARLGLEAGDRIRLLL